MEKVKLAVGEAAENLVRAVRERYGKIAADKRGGGCCGSAAVGAEETALAVGIGYKAEDLGTVPEGANLGLGCGAPIGHLALKPGETVLDLGSGAGLDVFLAAKSVGPTGRAIGVDMTPEMLERARAGAKKLGLAHVEFREGRLEALPLEDASVDAVTSNCVVNLVPDKGAVFREVARVLKPGGRLVISDIILDGELPEAVKNNVLAYVGCVAGASQRADYFALLAAAGLTKVEVLRDVDYVASLCEAVPDEVAAFQAETQVDPAGLAGKVHSITFRATKPAAS